jgi:hypothetical protein
MLQFLDALAVAVQKGMPPSSLERPLQTEHTYENYYKTLKMGKRTTAEASRATPIGMLF